MTLGGFLTGNFFFPYKQHQWESSNFYKEINLWIWYSIKARVQLSSVFFSNKLLITILTSHGHFFLVLGVFDCMFCYGMCISFKCLICNFVLAWKYVISVCDGFFAFHPIPPSCTAWHSEWKASISCFQISFKNIGFHIVGLKLFSCCQVWRGLVRNISKGLTLTFSLLALCHS